MMYEDYAKGFRDGVIEGRDELLAFKKKVRSEKVRVMQEIRTLITDYDWEHYGKFYFEVFDTELELDK